MTGQDEQKRGEVRLVAMSEELLKQLAGQRADAQACLMVADDKRSEYGDEYADAAKRAAQARLDLLDAFDAAITEKEAKWLVVGLTDVWKMQTDDDPNPTGPTKVWRKLRSAFSHE